MHFGRVVIGCWPIVMPRTCPETRITKAFQLWSNRRHVCKKQLAGTQPPRSPNRTETIILLKLSEVDSLDSLDALRAVSLFRPRAEHRNSVRASNKEPQQKNGRVYLKWTNYKSIQKIVYRRGVTLVTRSRHPPPRFTDVVITRQGSGSLGRG